MLVHPNIDPVAFSIGPLAVRWYGLMYLVGFAAGWWLGLRRIAKGLAPVTRQQFDDLLFMAVLGVILGGRLGYVLFYKPGYYLAHPLEIFAVWQGGMSFHGGLLGVILAMAISSRRSVRSALRPADWETSSMVSFTDASRTCRGGWYFAARATRRVIRRSSTSSRSRGSRFSRCCGGSRPSRARAARYRRCFSSAMACFASSPSSAASPTAFSATSRSA